MMTRHDLPILSALILLAVFIWTRDLRWATAPADAWPLLAALPVFWWLRRPWQRKPGVRAPLAPGLALLAGALLVSGLVAKSGALLAAGWTAMLWSWVSAVFVDPAEGPTRRLLALPLLAFPWLVTDFARVVGWMRLTSATVTEKLLVWFSIPAERDGALLWGNGVRITIEETSVGANGPQIVLLAGTALAFLRLGRRPGYWWHLPVLALAAWLSATLHLLFASLAAGWVDAGAAGSGFGWMLEVSGWVSLLISLAFCHTVFGAMAHPAPRRGYAPVARARRWPVEIIVLAGVFFAARGLVPAWRWTPYDLLGWLAFTVWLVPIWWTARQSREEGPYLGFSVAALVVLGTGVALETNSLRYVALALALAAFHPPEARWVWLAAAAAWMPGIGWLGSRYGFTPNQFAVARVAVAAVAAAWSVLLAVRRRADELADPGMILTVEPKGAP
jgi:hypothetical protein